MNCLFVYGTLCPGKPNAHLLENIGGSWKKGYIRGTLYQSGWGAAMGYPGVVPDRSAGRVDGYVFYSDNLPAHWEELDAFEGEGYLRVPVTVQQEDGKAVDCFVYMLKEVPHE
jgi:gamma-glutamylcyclotransferase (GGCT)/AIG2-like uncharacterized protein YtfP